MKPAVVLSNVRVGGCSFALAEVLSTRGAPGWCCRRRGTVRRVTGSGTGPGKYCMHKAWVSQSIVSGVGSMTGSNRDPAIALADDR